MKKDIAKIIDNDSEYRIILKKEPHHKHKIIISDFGVIRWKMNANLREVYKVNLNDIIRLFSILGITKNHELYRKLYRDLGYSLDGYWEIFYSEANNPDAKKYKANKLLV